MYFLFPSFPPLFFGLISCILGILCTTTSFYFLPFFLLTLISLIWFTRNLKQNSIYIFIFFLLGCTRSLFILHHTPIALPAYHITVQAKVITTNYSDCTPWHYQTILKISRIFTFNGWQNKSFILHLYTKKHPRCCTDDTIHYSIEKIPQPEGEFAWYLLKEGVTSTIFQEHPLIKITNHPSFSSKRFLEKKRKSLHKRLSQLMTPTTFALFSSLFLGNKFIYKKEIEEEKPFFKFWGISHILARSGLHLLIFLLLWSKLLCLFPAPFLVKQGFLFIITFIYFLLSWPSIAFNRAFYTFLFYKAATFLNRTNHEMHILSFVCLIILLQSPLQIFFLDFQLTFLLTFCLIWISLTNHKRKITIPKNIVMQKGKIID